MGFWVREHATLKQNYNPDLNYHQQCSWYLALLGLFLGVPSVPVIGLCASGVYCCCCCVLGFLLYCNVYFTETAAVSCGTSHVTTCHKVQQLCESWNTKTLQTGLLLLKQQKWGKQFGGGYRCAFLLLVCCCCCCCFCLVCLQLFQHEMCRKRNNNRIIDDIWEEKHTPFQFPPPISPPSHTHINDLTFLMCSADPALLTVDGAISTPPCVKTDVNSYSPSKNSARGMWKVASVVTWGGSRRNSCSGSPFFFFLAWQQFIWCAT